MMFLHEVAEYPLNFSKGFGIANKQEILVLDVAKFFLKHDSDFCLHSIYFYGSEFDFPFSSSFFYLFI